MAQVYLFVTVVDAFDAQEGKFREAVKHRQDTVFHAGFSTEERHQTRLHFQLHPGVGGDFSQRRYQPDPPGELPLDFGRFLRFRSGCL